jgi:tRNA threonylcarbamoyladenosine biosynthesis protein TsaB
VRILAFDTSTRATTVALWDSEGASGPAEARDDPPAGGRPRHTTRLLPLIVELLDRQAISWHDLDRIAVGIGPGTFTGLRIGIATARALGRARAIPLVGVSTLRSLAFNAMPAGERPAADAVIAVIDARRREVFAAGWRLNRAPAADQLTSRQQFLAPRAMPAGELSARLERLGSPALAIGDGAVEFRSVLEQSGALVPDDDSELHRVTAINHCRLAVAVGASGPHEIQPEYLRLPDAEIARRAANSR